MARGRHYGERGVGRLRHFRNAAAADVTRELLDMSLSGCDPSETLATLFCRAAQHSSYPTTCYGVILGLRRSL
jgi:hypothetical protein